MEVLVTGLDAAAVSGLPIAPDARRPVGERWRLRVSEPSLGPVVSAVEEKGGRVLSVQPVRQSLEEYFFRELEGAAEAPQSLELE